LADSCYFRLVRLEGGRSVRPGKQQSPARRRWCWPIAGGGYVGSASHRCHSDRRRPL